MPERRYNSKEIEELWGLPQAEYQKLCRARYVGHFKLGKPGAIRPRYASTARQIEQYFKQREVRPRL